MCLPRHRNDRPNPRPGKPGGRGVALLPVLILTMFLGHFAGIQGAAAQGQLSEASTALFTAVELNDMAAVERSLAEGADVEAKNPAGRTALDIAVDMGHFRIAHFLLAHRNGNGAKKTKTASADGGKSKKPAARGTQRSGSGGAFDPSVTARPRRKPQPPAAAAPMAEPATPLRPEASDEAAQLPATGADPALPPPVEEAASEQPSPRVTAEKSAKDADEPSLLAKVTDWLTPSFLFGGDDKTAETASAKTEKKLLSPWARYQRKTPEGTADRVMDRVTGMIGTEAPAEDEHGLPVRQAPDPAAPPAAEEILPPGIDPVVEVPPGSDNLDSLPIVSERAEEALPLPAIEPAPTQVPAEAPATAAESVPGLEGLQGLETTEVTEPLIPLPAPQPGAPGRRGKPLVQPPTEPAPQASQARESTTDRLARLRKRITEAPASQPVAPGNSDLPNLEALPSLPPLEGAPSTVDLPPVDSGQELPTLPSAPQEIAVPDPPARAVTMRERLDRLGRTVDRKLTRDPTKILSDSRARARAAGEDARTQITDIVRPRKKPKVPATEPYPVTQLPPQRELRYGAPRKPAVPPPAAVEASRRAEPRRDPARRFFDRISGLGVGKQPEEDIHGLPIAKPLPPAPTIAKVVERQPLREDVKRERTDLIDRVAGFFRHDEPGRRDGATGKNIETEHIPPLIVDTLQAEPDHSRGKVVDDRLLDLTGVELKPATAQPRANAPADAFLDKLANVLSPADGRPQRGGTGARPSDSGGLGANVPGATSLAELDLPPDQVLPDKPPSAAGGNLSIPDPWTMTIEQAAADGGASRTLAVQSVSPEDGSVSPAETAPGVVAGMIDKVKEMFDKGPRGRDSKTALKLDDDERLATAERLLSEALRAERPPGALPDQSDWPITQVQANKVEPTAVRRGVPGVLTQAAMTGVTFMLGESVTLENTLPPLQDGVDAKNECIKKNRATTLFCVEPIDWPDAIRNTFIVPTILYTGPMAIVRYDQGAATRFHALFPSEQFGQVSDYYQRQFGEPTEIWKRSIAPLAQPRRDNPTVTWRSRDPETNAVSVLEIRMFDDSRGGFPDTKRGAVMLYYLNAPPIFPQVSSHELMRLRKTR